MSIVGQGSTEAHQQPVLYGTGADFPLLALKHDMIQPAPPLPRPATYPPWRQAGWAVRDRWRAAASEQVAPLAYRQMERRSSGRRDRVAWEGSIPPESARTESPESVNL